MKNHYAPSRYYLSAFLYTGIACMLFSCGKIGKSYYEIADTTQYGTAWRVMYYGKKKNSQKLSTEITKLAEKIESQLDNRLPESEVSLFNQGKIIRFSYPSMFVEVLKASKEVYEETKGAYDPTVKAMTGSAVVQVADKPSSAPSYALEDIFFDDTAVCTLREGIKLYTADLLSSSVTDGIAQLLNNEGIESYKVEVGNSVFCKGKSPEGEMWEVDVKDFKIPLYNKGLVRKLPDASKGEVIMDPRTGKPAQSNTQEAYVIARNCTYADIYSTAFMVLGAEEAFRIMSVKDDMQAFFTITDTETKEVKTMASDKLKIYIHQ